MRAVLWVGLVVHPIEIVATAQVHESILLPDVDESLVFWPSHFRFVRFPPKPIMIRIPVDGRTECVSRPCAAASLLSDIQSAAVEVEA